MIFGLTNVGVVGPAPPALFGQNMITDQPYLYSGLFIKLRNVGIMEKDPITQPQFSIFPKIKQTVCNNISYPIELLSLLQFGPLFSISRLNMLFNDNIKNAT